MENKDDESMDLSMPYLNFSNKFSLASKMNKREAFAMNAPDVPDWFRRNFDGPYSITEEEREKVIEYQKGKILPDMVNYIFEKQDEYDIKNRMALIKAWRYAYADMMLEE